MRKIRKNLKVKKRQSPEGRLQALRELEKVETELLTQLHEIEMEEERKKNGV
jgi:hypothetical protein